MTRNTEPTTLNERGDETHPAFAMIRASRISGGNVVLFDSDITHQHTVRITLETATRKRDLHSDWIHGHKQLVEVELSEAQWASFVSSMNTSGVPATLRWTAEDGLLPGMEYEPRLALSMAEVKAAGEKMLDKANKAMAAYEQAIEDKAGAKVIKEKRRALHYALANSGSSVDFAGKMLAEHAENVVQKARADVEAMVSTEAHRLGLTPGEARMVELPVLPGEVIEALEPVQSDTVTAECFNSDHQRCSGHTDDGELCECPHHDEDAAEYAAQG